MAAVTVPTFLLGIKLGMRGHRLRKLQKIVPKVTTENPSAFIEKLEVGDVLLFGSDKFKGLDKIKSDIFRKSEGYYVHSSVYIGDNKIAHINPGGNPVIYDLNRYIPNRSGSILAIRPDNMTLGQKQDVAKLAKLAVSDAKLTYGGPAAKMAIFGDTATGQKAIKSIFGTEIKDGKVICSSFVADLQQQVGVKHPKGARMVTSIDFRSLKNPPVVRYKNPGGIDFKTSKFQGVGFTIPAIGQIGYEYNKRKQ